MAGRRPHSPGRPHAGAWPWADVRVPRGIRAHWGEVFAAAAEHRTAIEINAYPDRQDLDFTLAGPAARAGCLISLGKDSHAIRHLASMDVAVARLIRAQIPRERVLNYWSAQHEMERWLDEKRVELPAFDSARGRPILAS